MKLAATANPKEMQEEHGKFLAASPVANFLATIFGPLPRTVRLLNAGAGALTADFSLLGYAKIVRAFACGGIIQDSNR